MNFQEAKELLDTYDQSHVLKYYGELTTEQQQNLLDQISLCDFSLPQMIHQKNNLDERGIIEPLPVLQLEDIHKNKDTYLETGIKAIQNTKVAAVLLAGGMGTRLGSDDPKGMYDIGISKPVYIFQRLVENLLDVVQMTDTMIPLYIMTSDKNHKATVSFFEKMNYFGYPSEFVTFFMQEMAVACDYHGKVLMEEKGVISMSPNGNGGWFSSIIRAGLLPKLKEQQIEWLNIFSVDNVLQRICDPVFVGATIEHQCQIGSKVVKKAAPDEKVGVMCLEDKKPSIVEYYELTDELMNAKDEKGEPAYNFGVILNYLFQLEKLEEIANRNLPLHIVEKKIAHIDENGNPVEVTEPNGYKFETLVLDMIHMADSCLPFEVIREKEFAPIKNKTGVDSVDSARELCKKNQIEL